VNDQDLAVLTKQDHRTLARWYCELNVNGWPVEIPCPEPHRKWTQDCRRWQLMLWIKHTVGQRLVSRTWNHEMSDEDFEDFYRGNYERDRAAWMRYMRRLGAPRQHAYEGSPRTLDRWLAHVVAWFGFRLSDWRT
jgi:hypothetical protein